MTWQDALKTFSSRLKDLYRDRLDSIILYGSRARGEAEDGSDIDLLVVLKDFKDFWNEFHKISPIAGVVSLEHDVVISALPIKKADLEKGRSPFILNVRKEGKSVA
ncbi:MAG: nucleotidyltransferase domain-containing protein [Candidatus Brocadiales bacterium]|nr:nucleotidyltransferase domain-containing protein [Candidatus Brocadiales bacterium]